MPHTRTPTRREVEPTAQRCQDRRGRRRSRAPSGPTSSCRPRSWRSRWPRCPAGSIWTQAHRAGDRRRRHHGGGLWRRGADREGGRCRLALARYRARPPRRRSACSAARWSTACRTFLSALGIVGTAAMIWVGGGIIVHGIEKYGPPIIGRTVHAATEAAAHMLPSIAGLIEWSVEAAISGVLGLLVGAVAIPTVEYGLCRRH